VPIVIYELNESAINFISQDSYEKSLILLQKGMSLSSLSFLCSANYVGTDPSRAKPQRLVCVSADSPQHGYVLLKVNPSLLFPSSYHRLGILEECALCLEGCLVSLNSDYLQQYFNDPKVPSLRLKMLKYKCKTHMQICALLS
jgi:hypothetical protein